MPVIVAHSISTFIVQKYIESFSVAGLVLINPVPPVSYDNVTKMLLHHWTKSITDNSLSSVEYLMNYYNIKITDNCSVNEFSGHQYQHLISDGSKALPVHPKLLTDLLGTDRVDVLVEKGDLIDFFV